MKFLFLSLLASGGISSLCPCDTGGSKCSPYCGCVRSCVEGETSLLNLQYDQPNRYFIACDSKNQISTTRYLQSVEINGDKCYILDKYNDLDVIESYTAEQFGLINFSSSVLGLTQMKEPLNRAQAAYQTGDNIVFHFVDAPENGMVLLPRAIGSNECNAFIPVSYRISTPIQTCRISERFSQTIPAGLVVSDIGYSKINGVYATPEIDVYGVFANEKIKFVYDEPIQSNLYCFNNDFGTSNVLELVGKEGMSSSAALKVFVDGDTQRYSPGTIPVFTAMSPILNFPQGSRDLYYPYDKAGQSHGYEYGSPMMVRIARYVTIGSSYLRFGSNSDYFVPDISNFETLHFLIDGDYLIAPPQMGNFGGNFLRFERNDNDQEDICQLKYFYKKYDLVMNSENDIVQYPNQNVLVYLKAQGNCNLTSATSVHIQTKFIEVNPFTNDLSARTYSEPYSATFGMIFDFMFDSTNDAIRTIGILFCLGLAGTIWVYTGFCLDYKI